MSDQSEIDRELQALPTAGRPVLIERDEEGGYRSPRVVADLAACVEELGLGAHHPVLVIVGGAGKMDEDLRKQQLGRQDQVPDQQDLGRDQQGKALEQGQRVPDEDRLMLELRRVLDLALVDSAEEARAVVLTGGTHAGVMKLAGEGLADRGVLRVIGVAPRAKIIASPTAGQVIDEDHAELDPNHHAFVLAPGEEWGAETEMLFELAELIAGDRRAGVVVLANGGEAARHEARRFMQSGWPLVTLEGTARAADDLAFLLRSRSVLHPRLRRRQKQLQQQWGDLSTAQIEVHRLGRDAVESLNRRLAWYLSDLHLLKNSYGTWAAYDAAAKAGRRLVRRVQAVAVALAAVLTVGSLVQGVYARSHPLGTFLTALPVLVALNASVLDFLLPRRNWMVMRSAAEATNRAIYVYRAHRASDVSTVGTDDSLVTQLTTIRQNILRSGVRNIASSPVGRPAQLSNAYDELSKLTVREYTVIRLGGQLTYYRNAAAQLERKQLLTLASSALLAATATWASSEVTSAPWVPILVLAGAALVMIQQRARWQDRIALYSGALTDLQAVRNNLYAEGALSLIGVVSIVESVLERENAGWLHNMSETPPVALPVR